MNHYTGKTSVGARMTELCREDGEVVTEDAHFYKCKYKSINANYFIFETDAAQHHMKPKKLKQFFLS